MQIIKKFDTVVNYIYPIMQNAPRVHAVLRDKIINALFEQVDLFIKAGKSGQKSKLYLCDAGLANLRYLIRFATKSAQKIFTPRQHAVALTRISECGSMLNSWINKSK